MYRLLALCTLLELIFGQYQGPSASFLFGYWPFDNLTKLDDYSNKWQANFHADSYYLISVQSGPFGDGECLPSYGIVPTAPVTPLVSYEKISLPEAEFSIAFYFYSFASNNNQQQLPGKDNFLPKTSFFSFGQKRPNSPELSLRYTKSGFFAHVNYCNFCTDNKTFDLPEIEFRPRSWNFVALTFDNVNSKTLRFYSSSGALLSSQQIPKGLPPLDGLSIGTLFPGDRMYCFLMFQSVIKPAEIARLPCVCRSRANCIDQLPYKILDYKYTGPQPDKLVGFWPMFESDDQLGAGLNEASTGLAPFEVDAVGLRLSVDNLLPGPPFLGAPRHLYATPFSLSLQKWTASYSDIKMTSDFTISFFLYRPKNRHLISVLIHTWNRLIIKAEGNFLDVYAGSSNGEEKRVVSAEVLFPTANSWNFAAITYDSEDSLLKIFNESGTEIFQQRDVPISIETPVDLSIGPAWPEDSALVCLTIFNTTLQGKEVAKLRRVCQLAGRPKRFQTNLPFSGPKTSSLVGYWALFDEFPFKSNCEVVETSKNPIESIKTDVQPNPFPHESKRLFSMSNGDSYILCYPRVEEGTSDGLEIGNSFTISFYLLTKQDYRVNERFGLVYLAPCLSLTLAYQGEWFLVIGTRSGGTRVILAKAHILRSKNDWNFIAMTYERSVITFYNKRGKMLSSHRVPRLWTSGSMDYVRIGPNSQETAIACLAVYNSILTGDEIAKLELVCRDGGYFQERTSAALVSTTTPRLGVKRTTARLTSSAALRPRYCYEELLLPGILKTLIPFLTYLLLV